MFEEDEKFRQAVSVALGILCHDDDLLFEKGLYEPCISHCLGVYLRDSLEQEYGDYDVDCEYDKVLVKSAPAGKQWTVKSFHKDRMHHNLIALAAALTEKERTKEFKLFAQRRKEIIEYFDGAREKLNKIKKTQKISRPDIIVHYRGDDTHNKLVIEIKLSGGDRCDVAMDLAKLMEFTTAEWFQYQYGLFVMFGDTKPFTKKILGFNRGRVLPLDLASLQPIGEPILTY